MTRRSIDINCDVGEADDVVGLAVEAEMFRYISSANIACGSHAGDRTSMERCVSAAINHRIAIGAHPSYPDRANFGRVEMDISAAKLDDSIAHQVERLARYTVECGGTLHHVKPHGALYHRVMRDADMARRFAQAVGSVAVDVMLIGMAGAPALEIWRDMGWRVAAEAFADRRYEPDGSLRDRRLAGAVIHQPEEAAAQALRIVRDGSVVSTDGGVLPIDADTICIHGDSPNANDIARQVQFVFSTSDIKVQQPCRNDLP